MQHEFWSLRSIHQTRTIKSSPRLEILRTQVHSLPHPMQMDRSSRRSDRPGDRAGRKAGQCSLAGPGGKGLYLCTRKLSRLSWRGSGEVTVPVQIPRPVEGRHGLSVQVAESTQASSNALATGLGAGAAGMAGRQQEETGRRDT